MKIKDGFVLKAIGDSFMVVPLGSQVVDFGSIIKLTETAAFLWEQLTHDVTKDELLSAMLSEYNVDEVTASRDIDKFLLKLKDADLLD